MRMRAAAGGARFSSVAFTAMVVIVVTGILQSWRQVGSLQALGQTAYGRLLVAKVAVFLLLIAVAVLAITALLGIATPPRPARDSRSATRSRVAALISSAPTGSPYWTARLPVGMGAMIRQAVTA
jgi:copper transport protein